MVEGKSKTDRGIFFTDENQKSTQKKNQIGGKAYPIGDGERQRRKQWLIEGGSLFREEW